MTIGNTILSPEAVAIVKRVRVLREFTKKTGYITNREQVETLLTLDGQDLLDAAAELNFRGFSGHDASQGGAQ